MNWIGQFLQSMTRPLKWWIIIAPWELGVRIRLGKIAVQLNPGPHLRIPFVDRIYVQSIRLRTITSENQTISTKDNKIAVVTCGFQFSITNITAFYNSVTNPEQTLKTLIESKISDCIRCLEQENITPAIIEDSVNKQLTEFENWGLGNLRCFIVGFAFVKTYRLISNPYNYSEAGLDNIEKDGSSGERK